MRRILRTFIEAAGTRTGLAALGRRMAGGSVAVVAYHNVIPPRDAGHGDASLHLPLPDFIDQIDRLTRTHRVVDIRDLSSDPPDHGDRRPRAVITFDDAYRGAVTLGLPELTRRGLPAVLFVSPALLGAAGTWWDELAEAGLLSPHARHEALTNGKGRRDDVRRRVLAHRAPPKLPASYRIASLEEVESACGGTLSIGSHAWAHEHLPSLSDPELTRTLARSLDWVRGLGEMGRPWLALPYGAGSRREGERALELGYHGVLRIAGGLWRPTPDRTLVPRINVPAGISPAGLELRTSGLLRHR